MVLKMGNKNDLSDGEITYEMDFEIDQTIWSWEVKTASIDVVVIGRRDREERGWCRFHLIIGRFLCPLRRRKKKKKEKVWVNGSFLLLRDFIHAGGRLRLWCIRIIFRFMQLHPGRNARRRVLTWRNWISPS